MRLRSIAFLALVLTGGAAASAGAARRDPAYDDDRALAEVASHEYRFETETDVTLPSVRCELPEVTSERPHLRGSVAIVLGRSHLGVEGRQVMALSPDPASDLEARSSGATLLPLAAELAYQARVTQASGARSTRVDVYADEAMPFSALRSVLGPTDLGAGLVVRDAETGHLRRLELTPSRGVGCRNEFLGHLVLRDGKLVSIAGAAVEPRDVRGLARTGWDVVLHVIGDPRVAEVASTVAAIDHSCAGAPDDREAERLPRFALDGRDAGRRVRALPVLPEQRRTSLGSLTPLHLGNPHPSQSSSPVHACVHSRSLNAYSSSNSSPL